MFKTIIIPANSKDEAKRKILRYFEEKKDLNINYIKPSYNANEFSVQLTYSEKKSYI